MGVDIIHIGKLHSGGAYGLFHTEDGCDPFRMRAGHMISVGTVGVACHIASDPGVTPERGFLLLDDHCAAAFCHNESVTVQIEGPACFGRSIISAGQGMDGRQPLYGKGCGGSLRTYADHCIRHILFDEHDPCGNGVDTGGACSGNGDAGAPETPGNGDLCGSDISNDPGDEPGTYLGARACGDLILYICDLGDAGEYRSENDADPFSGNGKIPVFVFNKTCIPKGFVCSGIAELHEQLHLLDLLPGHEFLRLEVRNFAGEGDGETRCIETGNVPDSGLPRDHVVPIGIHTDTQGRNRAHTGDHNIVFHSYSHFLVFMCHALKV